MKVFLLRKISVFFVGLFLLFSCNRENIEEFNSTSHLRTEVYQLPDGKKITLEYDTLKEQYVESQDLLVFEDFMLNFETAVIVDDGSEVLRLSTLEDEEKKDLERLKSNDLPTRFSRVRLSDNCFSGANVNFYLNESNREYRNVSLKTRCVHGVTPVDQTCQVDLYEKVSCIELFDNSSVIMIYFIEIRRRIMIRHKKFENPPSSDGETLKFDLSGTRENNRFNSVLNIKFYR